jgi:hypothetical protein
MGPLELRSSANDLASVASRNFFAAVGRKPQLFILKTRRSISEIYGRDPGRTVEIDTAADGRYGDYNVLLSDRTQTSSRFAYLPIWRDINLNMLAVRAFVKKKLRLLMKGTRGHSK